MHERQVVDQYVHLEMVSVHLYLMHYYISILCSIFDSNKLVTYLLWSPKNTNNFLRRL
jgi:hypothetical protein